jgi:Flp pilus assembly protein TadD
MQGKLGEAERHLRTAIEIDPNLSAAHSSLGNVMLMRGNFQAAVRCYARALSIKPGNLKARHNLANAHFLLACDLEQRGEPREAAEHYREAMRVDSRRIDAANNLAWLLATTPDPKLRDPAEAVPLAQTTCRAAIRPDYTLLDTLAAAYASAGRFEEAVQTAGQALELAMKAKQPQAAKNIRDNLRHYQARRPLVETG